MEKLLIIGRAFWAVVAAVVAVMAVITVVLVRGSLRF